MAPAHRPRTKAVLAVVAGLTLALTACSSTGGTGGATSAAPGSSASGDAEAILGTPNPASGDPVKFGVLNAETGAITFPYVYQAQEAAVKYVNEYRGGIGGRPIELVKCATDLQPSTSQRCANQVLDEDPLAILGAADPGSPGAIPVYAREDIAYIGGVPFTPVEQNYENAVLFSSISSGDNAAASVWLAQEQDVKTAAVVYTSDTIGTRSGLGIVKPTLLAAGVTEVTEIPIPPTASDVTSAVATVTAANPDLVYVTTPAACPQVLAALKQLGYAGKVAGVDTCTSPQAIQGSNGGAEGLYFASPVLDSLDADEDAKLYDAVLKKYAPETARTSLAAIGFQTVMNLVNVLGEEDPSTLTTESIVAAFKEGTENENFLGRSYTCDGQQIAGESANCNAYQQIRQYKDGKISPVSDWVTAGDLYTPPPAPAG